MTLVKPTLSLFSGRWVGLDAPQHIHAFDSGLQQGTVWVIDSNYDIFFFDGRNWDIQVRKESFFGALTRLRPFCTNNLKCFFGANYHSSSSSKEWFRWNFSIILFLCFIFFFYSSSVVGRKVRIDHRWRIRSFRYPPYQQFDLSTSQCKLAYTQR